MKTLSICMFFIVLLFASFPGVAQEDPVYGRKLITLSEEYVESFRPDSERPVPGTKPDEEWEQYYALRDACQQSCPVWSPDGSLIAFIGTDSVYIAPANPALPAEARIPTKLWDGGTFYEYQGNQYYINTSGSVGSLCFSPDGQEVLFDTHIIDEARGTVVTLQVNEEGYLSGHSIQDAIPVIRAVDIHTGETRIVEDNAKEPQFSRDGRYFSFMDPAGSVLTVREPATGTEWVFEGELACRHCFSGDGDYIIYGQNDQFYRIPVAGGEQEQISFDESCLLITTRNFPDCSPGDDYVLFDGNAGARSNTFYDEDGNQVGSYSTESMEKTCVLEIETGLSFPLVPIEGGVQSTGAKFSPDGTEVCYTMVNRDERGSQPEIYIHEFNGSDFMGVTCISFPSFLVF